MRPLWCWLQPILITQWCFQPCVNFFLTKRCGKWGEILCLQFANHSMPWSNQVKIIVMTRVSLRRDGTFVARERHVKFVVTRITMQSTINKDLISPATHLHMKGSCIHRLSPVQLWHYGTSMRGPLLTLLMTWRIFNTLGIITIKITY